LISSETISKGVKFKNFRRDQGGGHDPTLPYTQCIVMLIIYAVSIVQAVAADTKIASMDLRRYY